MLRHVSKHYAKLMADPDNYDPVFEASDFYMDELQVAIKEANDLVKQGKPVINAASAIAGMVGYRYMQLQEMEQIVGFLENREKAMLGIKRRFYKEGYARELTDTAIERYASTDLEVIAIMELRNMFCLCRNKWLGLTKQLDTIQWQIGNITRLKDKGIIEECVFGASA